MSTSHIITGSDAERIEEMVEHIEDYIMSEIEKVWSESDKKSFVYEIITFLVRQRARNIEMEVETQE